LAAVAMVLLASSASGSMSATGSSKSATCKVSNSASWGTGYSQEGGAGANCSFGTSLKLVNRSFVCNKPLARYGTLPLRVEVLATGPWTSGANAGAIILSSGCSGDGDSDTIDLIVNVPMKGGKLDPWGNGADAVKYNGFPGPHDLQWTGEFQCGHQDIGAHQDALQMQSGTNVSLVNGKTGYPSGLATCWGAGGAIFYSSANGHFPSCATLACDVRFPVDVVGGIYVACHRSLTGGGTAYPPWHTGTVRDAAFRTGRATDPNCGGSRGGNPCLAGVTLTTINLNCTGPIPQRPKKRRLFGFFDGAKGDAAAGTGSALEVAYGTRAAETLNIYPAAQPGSPVVVVVHGGGWVSGDKAEAPAVGLCGAVASIDMTCLSVNYSLGGANPWPVQLSEMGDVMTWVKANASYYNGDPTRVAFWGISAGGHIALEAAYRVPGIATVVSWSGPTDLLTWRHFAPVYCSGTGLLCTARRYDASPVKFVSSGYIKGTSIIPLESPPTYLAHSVGDSTVPFSQAVELDAALTAAGVEHEFLQATGSQHSTGLSAQAMTSTKAWLLNRLTPAR
jgi:acetyl esterase/lipase